VARLPATRHELKRSFEKHFHVYTTIDQTFHPMTRRLVLFYSVESGLKCHLLWKIGKNNTNDLQNHQGFDYLQAHGHDIKQLVKSSGISGSSQYILKSVSDIHGNKIEPENLHQIWRYGITVQKSRDEQDAEDTLKNIALWLKTVL
jgi:hypothetical protein